MCDFFFPLSKKAYSIYIITNIWLLLLLLLLLLLPLLIDVIICFSLQLLANIVTLCFAMVCFSHQSLNRFCNLCFVENPLYMKVKLTCPDGQVLNICINFYFAKFCTLGHVASQHQNFCVYFSVNISVRYLNCIYHQFLTRHLFIGVLFIVLMHRRQAIFTFLFNYFYTCLAQICTQFSLVQRSEHSYHPDSHLYRGLSIVTHLILNCQEV